MADESTTASTSHDDEPTPILEGLDIGKMLKSEGPVVKCVVLRAPKRRQVTSAAEDLDTKKPPQELSKKETPSKDDCKKDKPTNPNDNSKGKELFEDLVDEVEIDTTPRKNEVEKLLGGPLTFLGQYEDEGIVLMALRSLVVEEEAEGDDGENGPNDFASMSIKQLRAHCETWEVDTDNMLEKQDLVDALEKKEQELPLANPHKLQPPLHNIRVRGDIVIIKVAEVDDPLDDTDENDADDENDAATTTENTTSNEKDSFDCGAANDENDDENDEATSLPKSEIHNNGDVVDQPEFFLPYTKAEYLSFAARTDISAPAAAIRWASADGQNDQEGDEEDEDDDNNNGDEDDENDEDFQLAAAAMEEMTEEEEKSAMLNIVMAELLRKFREENERGPNSREVLEIRASVAEQLEMEVVTYDESQEEAEGDEAEDKKRPAEPSEGDQPKRKRVKFDSSMDGDNQVDEESQAGPSSEVASAPPKSTKE